MYMQSGDRYVKTEDYISATSDEPSSWSPYMYARTADTTDLDAVLDQAVERLMNTRSSAVEALVVTQMNAYRAAGVPLSTLELVEERSGRETRWWVRIRKDVELTGGSHVQS